jgi:hypothetical protein
MTVCDTPPPDRRDTYGWDRTPDHAPIILAVLALLSVFWLFVCGGLARGPHWNGSPRTLESYQRYQESYDRLDREYARWGTSAAAVHGTVLLLSLLVSFVLVLASFCLWDRQGVPGRVLTITAGVFLLFPCFGVMLGIFGG